MSYPRCLLRDWTAVPGNIYQAHRWLACRIWNRQSIEAPVEEEMIEDKGPILAICTRFQHRIYAVKQCPNLVAINNHCNRPDAEIVNSLPKVVSTHHLFRPCLGSKSRICRAEGFKTTRSLDSVAVPREPPNMHGIWNRTEDYPSWITKLSVRKYERTGRPFNRFSVDEW